MSKILTLLVLLLDPVGHMLGWVSLFMRVLEKARRMLEEAERFRKYTTQRVRSMWYEDITLTWSLCIA